MDEDGFFTKLGKIFASFIVGIVIAGFGVVVMKGVGLL